MNIDQIPEAGAELNRLVAKQVMGWTLSAHKGDWIDKSGNFAAAVWHGESDGSCGCGWWNPSTDISPAWQVHLVACSWLFSKRRRYLEALQDCARTSEGLTVAWPDVLVALRDNLPRAICTAALMAVRAHRASWMVEMAVP